MHRYSKQRINTDIVALKDTLDPVCLTDRYRIFKPKEAKYIFLSNAHGTFSKIDHMTGPQISLKKFKKIEIIKQFLGSQLLETRYKPQGKNSTTVKYMETE